MVRENFSRFSEVWKLRELLTNYGAIGLEQAQAEALTTLQNGDPNNKRALFIIAEADKLAKKYLEKQEKEEARTAKKEKAEREKKEAARKKALAKCEEAAKEEPYVMAGEGPYRRVKMIVWGVIGAACPNRLIATFTGPAIIHCVHAVKTAQRVAKHYGIPVKLVDGSGDYAKDFYP